MLFVDFKLLGCYVMEDLYCVGGMFVVFKMLFECDFLYGDCLMVIGKMFVENFVDFFGLVEG